jgi:hypothetical protein
MYTCLTMNMSATANIETPIAQIGNESNCDVGGYGFRQCAIFNSPAFRKIIVTQAGRFVTPAPLSGYLIRTNSDF